MTLLWAICFLARCAGGSPCGPLLYDRAIERIEQALYEEAPRGWLGVAGDSASWRLAYCTWPDSVDHPDGTAAEVDRHGWLLVRYAVRGTGGAWELARDPRWVRLGPVSTVRCWDVSIYEGGRGTVYWRMGAAQPLPHARRRELAGELVAALPWRCEP